MHLQEWIELAVDWFEALGVGILVVGSLAALGAAVLVAGARGPEGGDRARLARTSAVPCCSGSRC